MEYEISFSNPHTVFLSEEKRNEIGVTVGDPIELNFNDFETLLVAKCEDI